MVKVLELHLQISDLKPIYLLPQVQLTGPGWTEASGKTLGQRHQSEAHVNS